MTKSNRRSEGDRSYDKPKKKEKIPTRGSGSVYKEEGTHKPSEEAPKKRSSRTWSRFSLPKSSRGENTRVSTKDSERSSLGMREVRAALPSAHEDEYDREPALDSGDSDLDAGRRQAEINRMFAPPYDRDSGDSEDEYFTRRATSRPPDKSTDHSISISEQLVELESQGRYKEMDELYKRNKS